MPVIVYKTMNLKVRWAQIRRIRCAQCPATFAYVASGVVKTGSTGLPLISSDDAMRASVQRSSQKSLDRIGKAPERGIARCAACHHPQPWMVRRWFLDHPVPILLTLLFATPFAVIAGLVGADVRHGSAFSWPVFVVAMLALLGALFAVGWARVQWHLGPAEGPTPRAMRDPELRAFLDDCAARDLDPALTWWFGRVRKADPPADVALVSLPFLDLAGGFEPPGPLPPPVPGAAPRTRN